MKRAALYGSLVAALCACSSGERGVPQPGDAAAPPPTPPPDAQAQREADAESARTFATDDPRVAKGIAENKEAFDNDGVSGVAEPK
jgi:hypothetical protein